MRRKSELKSKVWAVLNGDVVVKSNLTYQAAEKVTTKASDNNFTIVSVAVVNRIESKSKVLSGEK